MIDGADQPGCKAIAHLLEAIVNAEIAAADVPHMVVYADLPHRVVTCTGPYGSAIEAFLAAAHEAAELGEDSARYTIAPLINGTVG